MNRSGAIAAAYLMASERLTLLNVVSYLKSKRFVVLSNKGFRRQLIRFAREKGLLDLVETGGTSGKPHYFRLLNFISEKLRLHIYFTQHISAEVVRPKHHVDGKR